MSVCAAESGVKFATRPNSAHGNPWRRAPKPLSISHEMARASARSTASAGQSPVCGSASAAYSQIASDSWIGVPSTRSTGNRPRTLPSLRRCASGGAFGVPMSASSTVTVSNFAPACVNASQGRIDHDE